MDIEQKTDLLLFGTFGGDGIKSLLIQDNQKVIEKILLGNEQLTRTDKKIMLGNIKFSLNACKNLSKNKLENLSEKARDFFCFIQSFWDRLQLSDFVNFWVGEDRIQNLDTVNCGIFQIYLQETKQHDTKTAQYKTKQN